MKIILFLLFAFSLEIACADFDIPEEFYPPPFLTTIFDGYLPFYVKIVEPAKFDVWLNNALKQHGNGNELHQAIAQHYENEIPDENAIFGEILEHDAAYAVENLTKIGNLSISCLGKANQSFEAHKSEFCTTTSHCSNGGKTLILCPDSSDARKIRDGYDDANYWAPSPECPDALLTWQEMKFIKHFQMEGTRFQNKRGRFYCPSEVSCLEEILFDPDDDVFTFSSKLGRMEKLLLNISIFLIIIFLIKELQLT